MRGQLPGCHCDDQQKLNCTRREGLREQKKEGEYGSAAKNSDPDARRDVITRIWVFAIGRVKRAAGSCQLSARSAGKPLPPRATRKKLRSKRQEHPGKHTQAPFHPDAQWPWPKKASFLGWLTVKESEPFPEEQVVKKEATLGAPESTNSQKPPYKSDEQGDLQQSVTWSPPESPTL